MKKLGKKVIGLKSQLQSMTQIALIFILFMFASCSQHDPLLIPTDVPETCNKIAEPFGNSSLHNHSLLFTGVLTYVKESGSILCVPTRSTAKHWDVTKLVTPPLCPDCISITLKYHDSDERLIGLNVELKNPTLFTAHDVRVILMPENDSPDQGIRLLNADAYTELWDDGGQVKRNPFIAFGKENELREFPQGYLEESLFRISYNKFQNLVNLPFAVDACWPGNCPEPFDLVPSQDGEIYTDGSGAALISIILKSWKLDGEKVTLDLSPVGGDPEFPLMLNSNWQGPHSRLFETHVPPIPGLTPGEYEIWIKGKTTASDIVLWDRVAIKVFEGGYPSNPTPICFFNIGFGGDPYFSSGAINNLSQSGYRLTVAGAGLMTFDVSQPESPVMTQNVNPLHFSPETGGYVGFGPEQVIDYGGLISAFSSRYGVRVYDADAFGHEDYLAWFNSWDTPVDGLIGRHGDFLYIMLELDPWVIYIADFTLPNSPQLYGPYELEKPPGYNNQPILPLPLKKFKEDYLFEINSFYNQSQSNYKLLIRKIHEPGLSPELISVTSLMSTQVGKIGSMHLIDDFLVIAIGGDETTHWGFYVYDISNPSKPVFLKMNKPLGFGYDFVLKLGGNAPLMNVGKDMYIFDQEWLFDLGHLPDINLVGEPEINLPIYDIKGTDPQRKLVYCWLWDGRGPYIMDTSNPMNWTKVGHFRGLGPDAGACNVWVDENDIAYCAYMKSGLVLVDISDPEHPHDPAFVDTLDQALDVWPQNGFAYVADQEGGLLVVDSHDPTNPDIIATVPVEPQATTVEGMGSYLLVGRDWYDILVFDISNPASPILKTTITDPEEAIRYFKLDGFRLLYRTDNYLGLIDVSNADNIPPATRVFVGLTISTGGLGADNGLVFHEIPDGAELRDLNVHALTDPPVANFPNLDGFFSVFGRFGYNYGFPIPTFGTKVHIYDFTDPPNATKIKTIWVTSDGYHGSVFVHGNYAYLPAGGPGLEIVKLW